MIQTIVLKSKSIVKKIIKKIISGGYIFEDD